MNALRVASFNIRNGRALDGRHLWPLRRHATRTAIAALDADVVCLQEVYRFQRRYLLKRLPGYAAEGQGRAGANRGEQCPILFRPERVEVESTTTRWFGPDPDRPGARMPGASFPRIATMAVLREVASGTRFGIANLHLDERRSELRVESILMVTAWLTPGVPWLIVGDLNDTPAGPALEAAAQQGFASALPDDAPGTSHGFSGGVDGPRIDHILVSEGWEVMASGVRAGPDKRPFPSDHWPVFADLRLVAPAPDRDQPHSSSGDPTQGSGPGGPRGSVK